MGNRDRRDVQVQKPKKDVKMAAVQGAAQPLPPVEVVRKKAKERALER